MSVVLLIAAFGALFLCAMSGINATLRKLDLVLERLSALNRKGKKIMQEVEEIKAAVVEVRNQVGRAVSELHDLAGKITNTTDPAELAAIAASMRELAGNLKTAVDTVDTDGSSPGDVPAGDEA